MDSSDCYSGQLYVTSRLHLMTMISITAYAIIHKVATRISRSRQPIEHDGITAMTNLLYLARPNNYNRL